MKKDNAFKVGKQHIHTYTDTGGRRREGEGRRAREGGSSRGKDRNGD